MKISREDLLRNCCLFFLLLFVCFLYYSQNRQFKLTGLKYVLLKNSYTYLCVKNYSEPKALTPACKKYFTCSSVFFFLLMLTNQSIFLFFLLVLWAQYINIFNFLILFDSFWLCYQYLMIHPAIKVLSVISLTSFR